MMVDDMKTPQAVGKYRFEIIRRMLAGKISMDAAVEIQQLTDREIARLIHRNSDISAK
jgi:hypothetical protein